LVRNLSAFSILFAPGKSWDNVRSTAAPYTESRLARLVANERVGFPVVEHHVSLSCKVTQKEEEGISSSFWVTFSSN
jgi:hypothetical protein